MTAIPARSLRKVLSRNGTIYQFFKGKRPWSRQQVNQWPAQPTPLPPRGGG